MSNILQACMRGTAPMALIALMTCSSAGAIAAVPRDAAASMQEGRVSAPLAFPGAQGWAAHATGGRGGRIVRVTTLEGDGPGSFVEAVNASGPRIVVFEVGGVIDLGRKTIRITQDDLTIAGQTAPSPGVTLIRGGLDIAADNVIVRHIRVRPGSTGLGHFAGVDFDAISTVAARDVIVDHCSLTWATDENLSASGPRFAEGGKTTADFVKGTSGSITFSNNIIAEGLAFSTHPKGEHSKGSLIHDHVRDILIVGNLYAHNYERNPMFKGGVHGQVINNLIYNPGQRAVQYNLIAEEWQGRAFETGQMVLRNNVMRAGPSTEQLGFFMIGGSGDIDLYADGNLAVDRTGLPVPQSGRYTTAPVRINALAVAPALPYGVSLLATEKVQDAVIASAGARPWDRDDTDRRILADTIEGRGRIIDSEADVGGYPVQPATQQAFVPGDWNLDTMESRVPLKHRAPLR